MLYLGCRETLLFHLSGISISPNLALWQPVTPGSYAHSLPKKRKKKKPILIIGLDPVTLKECLTLPLPPRISSSF